MPAVVSRWSDYVLESDGRLEDMLAQHFKDEERSVCFILGRGFDPRMPLGLDLVLKTIDGARTHIIVVEFGEGTSSPSHQYDRLVNENIQKYTELQNEMMAESRRVEMWAPDGRRVSSRSAARAFRGKGEFSKYTDVIVDVSSLPRSIFYPLLAKLLYLVDQEKGRPRPLNLFVLVAENPALDRQIIDEGIDEDADYVHPFGTGAERLSVAERPKFWIPVLGESQSIQLQKLYDLILPDEICPVLPSPSLHPRRADELIAEYQQLLFDRLRVEPQNIIYASERNPFEVYGQVRQAVCHYQESLTALGGCRTVISSVSTKLLSLGVLLAAYELKQARVDLAIAHVESHGYRIEDEQVLPRLATQSVLFGLWLAGECYG